MRTILAIAWLACASAAEECALSVRGPVVASQDNLVATTAAFPNYELSFTMELLSDWSITGQWQSILTIGDSQGQRFPVVQFHESKNALHVMQSEIYCESFAEFCQYGVRETRDGAFTAGGTYEIRVVVESNQMTVYVDGIDVGTESGSATYVAADAAVYVGDPWHFAARVMVSDICLKEIVVQTAAPTTAAPTSTPAPTVTRFLADDITIRAAVAAWIDDRAAAEASYGHISRWDTREVTDMSMLFCVRQEWMGDAYWESCVLPASARYFNDDISAWDTSAVTDMGDMFHASLAFNQPIGNWRVDAVTRMAAMFTVAAGFNQPIGGWRVDKVEDMSWMFHRASTFNQPIDWNVGAVTTMFKMFQYASSFDQPLSDWDIGAVTDMSWMFEGASSFDQKLDWCLESVETRGMFSETRCDLNCLNSCFGRGACNEDNTCRCFSTFSGERCDSCAAGAGGSDCKICAAGTSSGAGDTECSPCLQNEFSASGAGECVPCGPNTFADPGASECEPCPDGTSRSTDQASCTPDPRDDNRSARRQRRRNRATVYLASIICSVMLACLLILGCALMRYRRRRKELEREREVAVQEQTTAARERVREFQAHFVTVSGTRFMTFDRLRPQEELRDELIIYDLIADVRDASTRGEVFVFFSHQWLGFCEPDPRRVHLAAMQQAVQNVSKDTETPLEKIRVWVDYISIPQKNPSVQKLAIASLPTFASCCDYFVVIAPDAIHKDTGCVCNSRSYRRRAWCRAEIMSCWARNGTSDMYYNSNDGLKPLVVSDELLAEALDVMGGEYTCCRLGHPDGAPCDREALMLPLLGLYADVYRERHGKRGQAYAFIEPIKSRLFPTTFEYTHINPEDGVETTTTQVLFGTLVAAVEHAIDQEKKPTRRRSASTRPPDFKPGTHAQPHRYHLTKHGRQLGRVTPPRTGLRGMLRGLSTMHSFESARAASPSSTVTPPRKLYTGPSWRAAPPPVPTDS